MYSFVPIYPSGIWSWTFASENKNNFLISQSDEIKIIEESCDIWNQTFQEGAFKMKPNKIKKRKSRQD